jgi:hypothetical protein
MLVSPFIKIQATEQVVSILQHRGVEKTLRVMVLTNLRPENLLNGSTDLEALSSLARAIPNSELVHLPSLHAKVYIADERLAVVTSANLTQPGIRGNLEYGVALTDPPIVREVRRDFERYSSLGARITNDELDLMLHETQELKDAFIRAERSARLEAKRALAEKFEAVRVHLLRQRARGRTTHAILSDTILFFLEKGPLRTTDLHPLIQQLHPDICDDSVDRVIDGVHFGKRWKHYVRTAQAFLKRKAQIHYDGERWHLVSRR